MKKIIIIDGHPDAESFCRALADRYEAGAREAGFPVDRVNIRDLAFDPVNHCGYRQEQPLEPDLVRAQERLRDATHLVMIVPVWWGGMPALLKGFVDRTFTPGFSHRFDPATRRPVGLLTGRSATVLYTQGAPFLYSLLVTQDGFWRSLKRYILDFCGLRPLRRFCFDKVRSGTDLDRKQALDNAFGLGKQGA